MAEEKNEEPLKWGSIYVEDLLRQIYRGKNVNDMDENEVFQLLEDLI